MFIQAVKMKKDVQLDVMPQAPETESLMKQTLRTNAASMEDNVTERVQAEQKETMNNRFWSSIPSPKRDVVFSKTNTNGHVRKATLEFSTPIFEPGSVKNSKLLFGGLRFKWIYICRPNQAKDH